MRLSKFGEKFTGDSGILQLMDDLGNAVLENENVIMLGGGNPSHIPQLQVHFREQMRDILQFARDNYLDVIPNTNLLGHANWIVLKKKHLQEDGKPHQICSRHPETRLLIADVLDEMLDVCDYPKRLHVGLDEVRWKTLNLPESERCPRSSCRRG